MFLGYKMRLLTLCLVFITPHPTPVPQRLLDLLIAPLWKNAASDSSSTRKSYSSAQRRFYEFNGLTSREWLTLSRQGKDAVPFCSLGYSLRRSLSKSICLLSDPFTSSVVFPTCFLTAFRLQRVVRGIKRF